MHTLASRPEIGDELMDGLVFEEIGSAQQLMRSITNPFLNHLIPVGVLKWFMRRSKSPLVTEMFRWPGSWKSVEITYANAAPVDWIDRLALRQNAMAIATRNRRKVIVKLLAEMLRRLDSSDGLNLLGIGAGPGLQMQEGIVAAGLPPERVSIHVVDLDDNAFGYGLDQARKRGLEGRVRYVQGDARELSRLLPGVEFDLVKIVGLIEYLTDPDVITLFQTARNAMSWQGQFLTHGLIDRLRSGPFLRRTFGLNHHYRSGDDVARLLQAAGLRQIHTHLPPPGMFPVVQAALETPTVPGR